MNPFTMVFSELWQMLLEHPQFVRDVREGNRIRFDKTGNRDPLKDHVQAADVPEVCLVASTGSANLMGTSSSSSCVRQYSSLVSTGDYRYTEYLGVVEWYIFCALTGWKGRLAALKWKDQNFVKRLNVVSTMAGMSDPERNRNIAGWSAVWTIEVEMHFNTSGLQGELRCAGDTEN